MKYPLVILVLLLLAGLDVVFRHYLVLLNARPCMNHNHTIKHVINNTVLTRHTTIYDYDHYDHINHWAQRIIHQHQNPQNCSATLVTNGWSRGLGSEIHVVGTHLAYAMEHGLILTWGPKSCHLWINKSTCEKGCQCLYRELTHCRTWQGSDYIGEDQIREIVPSIFVNALKTKWPSMTRNQILYWWRAQSAAYIMRLQRHNLDTVRAMRYNPELHYNYVPVLSKGTINAHIRGGDKSSEMKLVPPTVFVDRFVSMIAAAPLSFSRTMFVSSDDADAISYCKDALEAKQFTVIYSHNERMRGGHDIEKVNDFHKNITHTFLSSMVQLYMALEADAWIGTRGSNWNRLIDELRCVWVDKCGLPFHEVGEIGPDDYAW